MVAVQPIIMERQRFIGTSVRMHRSRRAALLVFVCVPLTVGAQQFQWAAVYNDPGLNVRNLAVGPDGAAYLAGQFSLSVDMDPGAGDHTLDSHGGLDAFLTRFESTGEWAWTARIGGMTDDVATAVEVDPNGNVVVVGSFSGTADLDPGPALVQHASAGSDDVFVVKLDPSGNLIWVRTLAAPSQQLATAVATDPQGNVWIGGSMFGTADFDPGIGTYMLTGDAFNDWGFLWKLDAAGGLLWAGLLPGLHTYNTMQLSVNSLGELHVSGTFNSGTIDLDPGLSAVQYTHAPPGSSATNSYLFKLTADGSYMWSKHWPVNDDDDHIGLAHCAFDPDGNLILAGSFSGTVDLDPGAGSTVLSSVGGVYADALLAKLDPNGALVWVKTFGDATEESVFDACVDPAGNIMVGGIFEGATDLDPGPGSVLVTADGWRRDLFMTLLDSEGAYEWSGHIGAEMEDWLLWADTDADGNFILGGYVQSLVDMDPGPGTSMFQAMSPLGHRSYFVMKLGAGPLGVESSSHHVARAFPVPSNGALNITSDQLLRGASILDLRGALVMQQSLMGTSARLDLSALAEGTYFLQVALAAGAWTQVIVKE